MSSFDASDQLGDLLARLMAEHAIPTLHLTAASEVELGFGLAIMPPGTRCGGLAEGLERILRTGFANRVLPLDSAAMSAYTAIIAVRRAMGGPMPEADSQIAVIALAAWP